MKDCYSILGIQRSATTEEIKKAFRKLAMIHHPDRPGGEHKKFLEIKSAYETCIKQVGYAPYESARPQHHDFWQARPSTSTATDAMYEELLRQYQKSWQQMADNMRRQEEMCQKAQDQQGFRWSSRSFEGYWPPQDNWDV